MRPPTEPVAEAGFVLETKDCLDGMRELAAGAVELVVTSPPYNLGIRYASYDDRRSRDEYLAWTRQWAGEVKRLLADAGSFFLNLGASPSDPLLPHELVVVLVRDVGFVLQNTFHWIKSIAVRTKAGQDLSVGHFKPIRSLRYVNDCHEYVFHLTRRGDVPLDRLAIGVAYQDKSNIARWAHTAGRDRRCRGNTWFIPYPTIVNAAKERPHPATFPAELAVNCIRIHGCRPESVVLDPFLGIGQSALAAKRCGIRHFIGFDIDREYVRVAREALKKGRAGAAAVPRRRAMGRPRPRRDQEPALFDLGGW